jgi:hypothetical protein
LNDEYPARSTFSKERLIHRPVSLLWWRQNQQLTGSVREKAEAIEAIG